MAIRMGKTRLYCIKQLIPFCRKITEIKNLEIVILAKYICQLKILVNTWLFKVKTTFNNALCNQHWIESSMSWNSSLERRTMKSISQLGQGVQEIHISWKTTEHSGNKCYKREQVWEFCQILQQYWDGSCTDTCLDLISKHVGFTQKCRNAILK